ncbi:MAG: prenyltransferase/squalene oxidase repeat-containing protein [Pirellulaceae bacterium]
MQDQQRERVRQTLNRLRRELLAEKTAAGHWVGELAGSALSTATAISALSSVCVHGGGNPSRWDLLIRRGIDSLRGQQNDDGGFGDTDLSHSNIATSYLVMAASTLATQAIGFSLSDESTAKLSRYIEQQDGIEGLRKRYGKDKTFVIPILTNMAIAGLVNWDEVQALPFEAAVFPQSMYRFLQMPVVSYAIPALVAIGQARHFHGRRAFAPLRWIRSASISRTMNTLVKIQPESGGYLEATPLTSFVAMSLAVTGRSDHIVVKKSIEFLASSIREDGSWPIDTNLATWATSLAVHALSCDPEDDGAWCDDRLVDWHLDCQYQTRHPFTGAAPGGWGWTDLSGAVPDGDDTPGAMLAIKRERRWVDAKRKERIDQALNNGGKWLDGLQNRDGGWPTFCRGWGKLPFDRSSVDLTAHALRALGDEVDSSSKSKALRFINKQQRADGSWIPLWFGNQDLPDEINPVYGTSRVLTAACTDAAATRRGVGFLIANQNADGGWGGGPSVHEKMQGLSPELEIRCDQDIVSSVEETALAIEALVTFVLFQRDLCTAASVKTSHASEQNRVSPANEALSADPWIDNSHWQFAMTAGGTRNLSEAIILGVEFLLRSVDDGRHRVAWPIGFYFAKLWYYEKLYPLVFTVAALGKYLRVTAEEHDPDWPK